MATQGEPEHRAEDDTDDTDGTDGTDGGLDRRLGGRVRRWWPALSALVGALVWYPAGWAFPSSSPPPVQLLHGDAVFFGSCASALAASLVVTRWGARVVVLAVTSALLWVAVTPLPDPVPHEGALVAVLLVAGQLLGLLAGSLLRRGPARLAFGLALVAASTTTERWLPLLLVGVVACAAVRAGRHASSVALAVAAAVGALAVWLVGTLAHFAVTYGWGDVRRGGGYPTQAAAAVRRVLEPASDWLRDGSGTLSGILLRQHWTTLLVAVVVGVVVGVVVRVVREEAP